MQRSGARLGKVTARGAVLDGDQGRGVIAIERHTLLRATLGAVAACVGLLALPGQGGARTTCVSHPWSPARAAVLRSALASGRDVLGARLLASPAGPTYRGVRRFLPPPWYALGPGGKSMTESGAYYLSFGYSPTLYGEQAFGLHVADGSEIIVRRTGGPALSVHVGSTGELYGSCPARLGGPRLADGWLPILRTTYVDAGGSRYAQESFVGRIPGVPSVVSLVRLAVDAGPSGRAAIVRFTASRGARARLLFDAGGVLSGDELRYRIPVHRVIHIAWLHRPAATAAQIDEQVYRAARRAVRRFWERRLATATAFDLPERRVSDAYRNALVQQQILTWRYSIGNTYEELSFAEALDAARVMSSLGRADVSEAILRNAARRLPARYSNWRAGALLAAAATHVDMGGTLPSSVERTLDAVLRRFEAHLRHDGADRLLGREPFSSDVRRRVLAIHGQAVAWQGLESMSRAWERSGRPQLAVRARRAASRLAGALRPAIVASERRLRDGTLFVPAVLGESQPFDRITATRDGSYWNLVVPYVLASGLWRPDGPRALGVWGYMEEHGARLLGLVRADARRLYGETPGGSGLDQVYGLNMARFLADADMPDQLVLSLYATLAGTMTPNTFVAGEASTVVPLRGESRGSMYLPPNGGANATFLETLRLALVHERRDRLGAPVGLDLAFATPRAWLRRGATVGVHDAPTSFGPVSYTLTRKGDVVTAEVDRPPVGDLRLRLRVPADRRVATVEWAGRHLSFDQASGTIQLPARGRRVVLVVRLAPSPVTGPRARRDAARPHGP